MQLRTKNCIFAFPEVFHNSRFWGYPFKSRYNLTFFDIYSFSTQTTMVKYLQKSNFRKEEEESSQNENFHHSILLQFWLVLSLSRMRFQILPIWEGQHETVFTLTSLFSLRAQPVSRPGEKSQVWLWNRICQDWLQLWARSDAFACIQKLPAKTYHSHWYPKCKMEGFAALGCLIKSRIPSKNAVPVCVHVRHSLTLMIV